jgi:acyl carrier protein
MQHWAGTRVQEPSIEDVKKILAEVYNRGNRERVLEPYEIGDDTLLFDYEGTGSENLELDSLDALEASACLEDEYGIILPDDIDPARISSPRAITALVCELLKLDANR